MANRSILRITAERSQLGRVRAWVTEKALAGQAAPPEIDDLVQAADELVANTITHGYAGRSGLLELEMIAEPGMLILILRDQAPPFDPTHVPAPDISLSLEERPLGGMGLHLVRQCVDQFLYESLATGGNQITLIKNLTRRENQGNHH